MKSASGWLLARTVSIVNLLLSVMKYELETLAFYGYNTKTLYVMLANTLRQYLQPQNSLNGTWNPSSQTL